MRRFVLGSSLVLALITTTQAQGVINLDQRYLAASLRTTFDQSPCTSSSVPTILASDMVVQFQPQPFLLSGFTAIGSTLSVCSDGSTITGSDNSAGNFDVNNQGLLTLDFASGTQAGRTASWYLSADTTIAFEGRLGTESENYASVAIMLSSGQSNDSLKGDYFVARMEMANPDGNYRQRIDRGLITFDGEGAYTESGFRNDNSFGQFALLTTYQANGEYDVQSDGLIVMPNHEGAVSPDGELFFWLRRDVETREASLTIGVRKGSNYTQNLAAGTWGFAEYRNEVAIGAALETDFGQMTLSPSTALGGVANGSMLQVSTSPTGSSASLETISGFYTLQNDGSFFTGSGLTGGMGSKGTLFVAGTFTGQGGGIVLGSLRCPWPVPYGQSTPGTNGTPPLLTQTSFSYLGNSDYGIRIRRTLGSTNGALMLSSGVSAGIPLLGGTIWLDPSTVIAFPLAIGGSPVPGVGSATLAVPLPANPLLEGQQLVAQGFVVDPGAPNGLAMTLAMVIDLCRQ